MATKAGSDGRLKSQASKVFSQMDKDGDGMLGVEEIKLALQKGLIKPSSGGLVKGNSKDSVGSVPPKQPPKDSNMLPSKQWSQDSSAGFQKAALPEEEEEEAPPAKPGAKACEKCGRSFTGWGEVCGGCRKLGRHPTQKACQGVVDGNDCGVFFTGFGEECDECMARKCGVVKSATIEIDSMAKMINDMKMRADAQDSLHDLDEIGGVPKSNSKALLVHAQAEERLRRGDAEEKQRKATSDDFLGRSGSLDPIQEPAPRKQPAKEPEPPPKMPAKGQQFVAARQEEENVKAAPPTEEEEDERRKNWEEEEERRRREDEKELIQAAPLLGTESLAALGAPSSEEPPSRAGSVEGLGNRLHRSMTQLEALEDPENEVTDLLAKVAQVATMYKEMKRSGKDASAEPKTKAAVTQDMRELVGALDDILQERETAQSAPPTSAKSKIRRTKSGLQEDKILKLREKTASVEAHMKSILEDALANTQKVEKKCQQFQKELRHMMQGMEGCDA